MSHSRRFSLTKIFQLNAFKVAMLLLVLLLLARAAAAQKPVMWEPVNVRQMDLFAGPGGDEMRPDLSSVTFIKQETGGHNKKYRIKDGSGRIWVAKLGREAQPETAAVRLLYGIGYKTEINYLVPTITIPGKGTFTNVRLEARPENIDRKEEWKWKQNPFIGTNELQGLKILMVFLNNWDIVDVQNKVIEVDHGNRKETEYIVSDLGSTFGRLGNNNLPVIYRFGRSVNKPQHYIKSKFVKDVKDGRIVLAYKGKNRGLFKDITVPQARWLANLLTKLSDKQIQDAFLAANYSQGDLSTLTTAVKNKIAELDRASLKQNYAKK
jgi:hypothetical protein